MFDRFTDEAKRTLVLAQQEARQLKHNYVGTEHLLLGLLGVEEGIAAEALGSFEVSLEAARRQVAEIAGTGASAPGDQIPLTPRVKKVLELSHKEALQLEQKCLGTEHILLRLARESESVAAKVLVNLGVDLEKLELATSDLVAQISKR